MKIIVIVFALVFVMTSDAHSGRTDSSGGHNCSKKSQNKGLCSGYHSHSSKPQKSLPKQPEKKKSKKKN